MYRLLIPFVIIHIKIIQYRYKQITVKNYGNRNTPLTALLKLLQAKEYYYKTQFSAWGKYHPEFTFSPNQLIRHKKFMNWLFPEKDFKEWDHVIEYNPEAVTYYHNKIYTLNKGKTTIYHKEIRNQLKTWRDNKYTIIN